MRNTIDKWTRYILGYWISTFSIILYPLLNTLMSVCVCSCDSGRVSLQHAGLWLDSCGLYSGGTEICDAAAGAVRFPQRKSSHWKTLWCCQCGKSLVWHSVCVLSVQSHNNQIYSTPIIGTIPSEQPRVKCLAQGHNATLSLFVTQISSTHSMDSVRSYLESSLTIFNLSPSKKKFLFVY